jgi:DNA-directed RNA polymerase subunit RPC12/RpoP
LRADDTRVTTPDVAPRTRCPACGAATRPDDPWCTLCYAAPRPLPADDLPAPDLPADDLPAPDLPTDDAIEPDIAVPDIAVPGIACPRCSAAVPLLADNCPACGHGLLDTLRDSTRATLRLPVLGDLMRFSRGARLALAAGGSFLLATAAIGLLAVAALVL